MTLPATIAGEAEGGAGLRGLTWDHPRAYRPLAAVEASAPAGAARVTWERQSLGGFEADPIDALADRYDLLVIDHPGIGAAVAAGALLPLDEVFAPAELDRWAAVSVGPTWDSYRYAGRQWALPIDAATQVGVHRPDLVGEVPRSWPEVPAFAARHRTALCLAGPHAFLGFLGVCAARTGERVARVSGPLVDPGTAEASIALLQAMWRHCDREASLLDPIGIHQRLAGSDLAYCPLTYGYASYGVPEGGGHRLAWSAAPTWLAGRPGSVLGGTGLALSRRCVEHLDTVRGYVRRLLADDVASRLVPEHGGQPAHRGAWESSTVDSAWGGYYSATRSSLDTAWRRPRRPGWIAYQEQASELVRAAIVDNHTPATVAAELTERYLAAVPQRFEEDGR